MSPTCINCKPSDRIVLVADTEFRRRVTIVYGADHTQGGGMAGGLQSSSQRLAQEMLISSQFIKYAIRAVDGSQETQLTSSIMSQRSLIFLSSVIG